MGSEFKDLGPGRLCESEGFDPCLLFNEQIGVLVEEKKGCAAVLDHLMSERQNVLLHEGISGAT